MRFFSYKPWPEEALRVTRDDLKPGEKRVIRCEDGRVVWISLNKAGRIQRRRVGGVSLWREDGNDPTRNPFIGRIGPRQFPQFSFDEFQFYLERRAADAAGTLDALSRERGVGFFSNSARALEAMFHVKAHVYDSLTGELRAECLKDAGELLDQASEIARAGGNTVRSVMFDLAVFGLADTKARAA